MGVMVFKTLTIEDATECLIDYRGKTPPKTTLGIRLVTAKVVKGGQIRDEPAEYIASDFYDEWMRRGLPQKLDVLLTTEAPLGEVAILRNDARIALAQRIILLRAKPSLVDPVYLFYALQSDFGQDELKSRASGTTVLGIKQSELRKVRIPVFSLPAQQRIASILSAYDELIENSQRRIKILEAMARGLYREWFVHFRFPGHQDHPRVASALGEIPGRWEVKRLGDLISIDKGVSYNGAGLTEDGNPMVNLKNIIAGGGFRRDATKPYSGDFKSRHTVKPGDIILANTDLTQAGNVVASVALIPRFADHRPVLISHHLYAVRLSEGLPASFIYHLMLEDGFRGFAKGYAIGTTVLGLPKEGVLDFVFALPSQNLIADFVKYAAPLHQLIETLLERIDTLRRTRDLLIPRLLSGQIEV